MQKKWVKEDGEGVQSVTLELQYQDAEGKWKALSPNGSVVLDGNADADIAGKNCYEDEAWHAVWKAVPKYLPASKTDEHGNTIYRVEEKSGDGYEAAGSSVAAELSFG